MPEDEFLERLRQIKSKANKPADTPKSDAQQGEKTLDAPAGSESPKPELASSDKDLKVKTEQLKAEKAPGSASKAETQKGNADSESESSQQKFCTKLQGPNSVFSEATNGCVCKEGWAENEAGDCDKKVEDTR